MLNKILQNKERRVQKQRELIAKFHSSLLSLSINIPGDVKFSEDANFIFETALQEIYKLPFTILEKEVTTQDTGCEALFVIDADAKSLKEFTCKIENNHPLGRFMDIDVLDKKGALVSRQEFGQEVRKCYLCDESAKVCARNQAHSISDLLKFISQKVYDYKASL